MTVSQLAVWQRQLGIEMASSVVESEGFPVNPTGRHDIEPTEYKPRVEVHRATRDGVEKRMLRFVLRLIERR